MTKSASLAAEIARLPRDSLSAAARLAARRLAYSAAGSSDVALDFSDSIMWRRPDRSTEHLPFLKGEEHADASAGEDSS